MDSINFEIDWVEAMKNDQALLDDIKDHVALQKYCKELLPKEDEDLRAFADRVLRHADYLANICVPHNIKPHNSKIWDRYRTSDHLDILRGDENDVLRTELVEMVLRISDAILVDGRFVLEYNLGENNE